MAARKVRINRNASGTTFTAVVADTVADTEPATTVADGDGDADSTDSGSNQASSGDGIDPGTIGDSGSSDAPKRRGRKPGSKNRAKDGGTRKTNDLTTIIFTLHLMAANIAATPELMLSKDEAQAMNDAINHVNQMYDFDVIPEKTMAWINLAMTAGNVYGTRAIAIHNRHKRERGKVVTVPNPAQYVHQPSNEVQ